MKNKIFDINTKIPEKGVDIIGYTDDRAVYCFRCNCKNENCLEWRDSITGFHLDVEIKKWKYE